MLPVLHPDAAGIDIGAEEIYVAVPDRAEHSVRSSEHLRVTCMICATGLATARFELSRWSRRESIGSHCFSC